MISDDFFFIMMFISCRSGLFFIEWLEGREFDSRFHGIFYFYLLEKKQHRLKMKKGRIHPSQESNQVLSRLRA